MHYILILISRVTAFIIAVLVFYCAIFLYEDEEGIWQNRIDNLWIGVYDRAKLTNSTSTALFNKVSEVLKNAYSRIFGKRLLSIRAVAVSLNMSFAGIFLCFSFGMAIAGISDHSPFVTDSLNCLGLFLVFAFCAMLAIYNPETTVILFSLIPIGFVVSLPFIVIATQSPLSAVWFVSLVAASVCSDYLIIVAVRRLFGEIAITFSLARISLLIVAFIGITCLVVFVPLLLGGWGSLGFWGSRGALLSSETYVGSWGVALSMLNLSTAMMCLIPFGLMLVVLVHRLIWPTLSRVTYPLSKYAIITNRKVLMSVGSLCLVYAFNLEHVGIQAILKLFS